MTIPETPRHVEVKDGDRTVAAAEVTTAAGREGTARLWLHATTDRVPPGYRAHLVDAVMDLPEVRASTRLEATVPLGDTELLERLRERTQDAVIRPAGSTALLDANIPPPGLDPSRGQPAGFRRRGAAGVDQPAAGRSLGAAAAASPWRCHHRRAAVPRNACRAIMAGNHGHNRRRRCRGRRPKEDIVAIATINPATGETIKTFGEMSDADVERCLAAAARAYERYRLTSYAERAGWMQAAAGILDDEKDQIAAMMTTEMGKTLAAARQEVEKCAGACRYYAERAESYLADEPGDAAAVGAEKAYVSYQPLGPVLAIMPWNFPLWQAMRFAAPALMAGNVGLLKHASNVPQTALFMQDLFSRAGFPEAAFQTLLISSGRVEAILRDPRVVAATLTGSGAAGSSVAAAAGSEIKKVVLELGGSDPFVVMPSADLPRAAQVAAFARCLNNGQSCIAAKRFIAHDAVYDEFERLFTEQMAAKKVGDPMADGTDIGPLASEQQREDVEHLVADAVGQGAKVLCGGAAPEGPGFYYPPTVLAGITPEMRVHREEVFGPVATLYRVADIDEAIELANGTEFGLGANAWTNDEDERTRFIRDLASGMVFINGNVTSFPQLPFGGVKSSGHGRELSHQGIKEFCNIKTVWVGR